MEDEDEQVMDWEYDHSGILRWRDEGSERIYEVWVGTKWKERKPEPVGPQVTAEGQSRAVSLSALGTERKPTSETSGDGFTLYTVKNGSLMLGVVEVIVTPASKDVWLDEETNDRLEDNPKLFEKFIEDCETWSAGVKYLMEDVSYAPSFQDAKAKDARERHEGAAGAVEVDTIDLLLKRARALVVSAAEYNAEPSAFMAEAFALRLADIRSELTELQRRVGEVEEAVGLASSAVMDALS